MPLAVFQKVRRYLLRWHTKILRPFRFMIAQRRDSTYVGLFFLALCLASASSQDILRIPFTMITPAEHYTNSSAGTNLLGWFGRKKKKTKLPVDSRMRGKIGLGNPVQEFTVIFNTGSDRLWVFGENIRNHLYFDSSDDSSDEELQDDSEPFTHTFYEVSEKTFQEYTGDGKFSELYDDESGVGGIMGYETATIGGATIKELPFGTVNQLVGPRSQYTDFDGILGLGYTKKGSKSSSYSPLTHLVGSGVLKRNMFSVYRSKDGKTGEVILGGYDKKHLKGKEHKVPILHDLSIFDGKWVVEADKLEFGKANWDLKSDDDPPAALVDAGSTFLCLPAKLLKGVGNDAISNALDKDRGNAGYVPCGRRNDLPILTFTLGGKKYHLTGEDYVDTPPPDLGGVNDNDGCQLLIETCEDASDRFVIGAPFMKKYHTTYYYPTKKIKASIGFAEAAHSSNKKKKKWGFGK